VKVTKEMAINDVIRHYPQTIPVFNRFRVDSCCGGGQSLEKAALQDGIDLGALLQALNKAMGGQG